MPGAGEVRWYKCMECGEFESITWGGESYVLERPAPDARHGVGGDGTGPAHQSAAPATQGLSVSVTRCSDNPTEPGLEFL